MSTSSRQEAMEGEPVRRPRVSIRGRREFHPLEPQWRYLHRRPTCRHLPVSRHVSDAVLKYDKPVYGLFIAVRIDTNTAETFRHGIWYAKGDVKQRLDIVPYIA